MRRPTTGVRRDSFSRVGAVDPLGADKPGNHGEDVRRQTSSSRMGRVEEYDKTPPQVGTTAPPSCSPLADSEFPARSRAQSLPPGPGFSFRRGGFPMKPPRSSPCFELLVIVVVIGFLAALLLNTRSGHGHRPLRCADNLQQALQSGDPSCRPASGPVARPPETRISGWRFTKMKPPPDRDGSPLHPDVSPPG